MSNKPVKQIITISEHAKKGHRFNCWCQECGHSNSPSAEEMISKGVPQDFPIKEMNEILKCIVCGSTDICSIPMNTHMTMDQLRTQAYRAQS